MIGQPRLRLNFIEVNDMAKIKKGMCWHVWHNKLLSYCPDYDGRVQMIEITKPAHEVKPRLAWMQMVKGKLPGEVLKMAKVFDEVREAYNKMRYVAEAFSKVDNAYDKAKEAYDKVLKDNRDLIEKLHAEECPNCTWDGKRLYFSS